MPQSLVQNYQHVVFSTKHREPFLREPILRAEMHAYLGGICRSLDSPALTIGGVADHVHILCRLSKGVLIEDFLRDLKRDSSRWAKTRPAARLFRWQAGYGAFSVSPSHVNELRRYIAGQEEHHKHESFQDEYRRLLRKYGIEWDERYVWD